MEEAPLHFNRDIDSDAPSVDGPINRRQYQADHPADSVVAPRRVPSARGHSHSTDSDSSESSPAAPLPASIQPHGRKSLSGVALRAFLLGSTLGLSSALTVFLLNTHPCWRACFFLSSLSFFHFLEYYITARCNTPAANISAFLLSQNGRAYNAAHTAAFCECLLTSFTFPSWQARWSNTYTIVLGLSMMILGQATRSSAMAQAGTNFNHTVQTKRNEGHVLVTTGIYAWIRHPSYFGFFWWGIGTQLLLGNFVCFVAYTLILWGFFRGRTRKEEELLIKFFGNSYENYRAKTPTWIPFIK